MRKLKNKISNVSLRFSHFISDFNNVIKYGFQAPRFAERIWVSPRECKYALYGGNIISGSKNRNSATVVSLPWPVQDAIPIFEIEKFKYCYQHWVDGVNWNDTGAYEYMLDEIKKRGQFDGCRNLDDVKKRYEKLDRIYNQIKEKGRLLTRIELNPNNFREKGGIMINIGPDGQPWLSLTGIHRFSIAHILNIRFPAMIGYVHVDAIPYLQKYRQK